MSNMRHAISMQQYDIAMIVNTTQKLIDDLLDEYESKPIAFLHYVHASALQNAKLADRYFDKHPDRITIEKQKYQDLCDDCLIVTVTGMIALNNPCYFVHPAVFDYLEHDPAFDQYRAEHDLSVDYDESIPLIFL